MSETNDRLADINVKYELDKPVKDLDHYRLLINGTDAHCPFKTVHATPVGAKIGFMFQPCTTECPLAEIKESEEKEGKLLFITHCGGGERKMEVTVKKQEQLISLKPIIQAV